MSKPGFSWVGNDELESGTATYTVDCLVFTRYFETFKEANDISYMLEEAYRAGVKYGKEIIKTAVIEATNKL